MLDVDGQTTPRYTTIYDAAAKLRNRRQSLDANGCSIPILLPPSRTCGRWPFAGCASCRSTRPGPRQQRAAERKLLPACQHQVKNGMEVFTHERPGPRRGAGSAGSVGTITELLSADNFKLAPAPARPAAEVGRPVQRASTGRRPLHAQWLAVQAGRDDRVRRRRIDP